MCLSSFLLLDNQCTIKSISSYSSDHVSLGIRVTSNTVREIVDFPNEIILLGGGCPPINRVCSFKICTTRCQPF